MCSYDLDSFREFIQTEGFLEIFDISSDQLSTLVRDEDEMLKFSMQFLKQVLYGEKTIPMKPDAREKRIQRMRERMQTSEEETSSEIN